MQRPPNRCWPILVIVTVIVGCSAQPTPPSSTVGATMQPSETAVATESPRVEICDPRETPEEAPAGQVLVFFTCVRPPAVAGVGRSTDADPDEELMTVALNELLVGPTTDEQVQGLTSWFSSDTAGSLNGVSIDDEGVAVVDFADFSDAIPNASTTAGRLQLMSELRATIFQFDSVESAVLQFDGNCGSFWIWVASNPCTPLTPTDN